MIRAVNGTTFDTFSAARALESAGIERDQAEAIAGAIGARALSRADFEPLATKTELFALKSEIAVLRWAVGINAAATVATFAIVAAKLL